MNLLILTLDHWHWAFAEPLGNRWIQTPVLNRLAAMGTVFGQCYTVSPDAMTTWQSLLTGTHPLRMCPLSEKNEMPHSPTTCPESLPDALAHRGWRTRLLTDSERLSEQLNERSDSGFGDIESIPTTFPSHPPHTEPRCVDSMEDTAFFRAFSCLHESLDTLSEGSEPFLLATHLESLSRVWDAPREYRDSYVEGEDPAPSDSAVVPILPLPSDVDPDVRLAIQQAYSGQITLFDTLLEPLIDWLTETEPGRHTALLLMGTGGLSCNESVYSDEFDGTWNPHLLAERTHLPVFLRLPGDAAKWTRSATLVDPTDLHTLLRSLTGLNIPNTLHETTFIPDEPIPDRYDASHVRDRILVTSSEQARALLTEHWYLHCGPGRSPQLFLRRDDPFQVNDVATRCGEIVDAMMAMIPQTERSLVTATPFPPIPKIVTAEPS